MSPSPDRPNPLPQLDLHGLSGAEAERALARELHAWRVRGVRRAVVVTGRGWGNRAQEPVLRTRIERWLAGPDGQRLGVRTFRRVHREGALELEIG